MPMPSSPSVELRSFASSMPSFSLPSPVMARSRPSRTVTCSGVLSFPTPTMEPSIIISPFEPSSRGAMYASPEGRLPLFPFSRYTPGLGTPSRPASASVRRQPSFSITASDAAVSSGTVLCSRSHGNIIGTREVSVSGKRPVQNTIIAAAPSRSSSHMPFCSLSTV